MYIYLFINFTSSVLMHIVHYETQQKIEILKGWDQKLLIEI